MEQITNQRIKNRVAKVFGIEPSQVTSLSKRVKIVRARCAYLLSVHLLGGDTEQAKDEISKGTTPSSYYIDRGIDFFIEEDGFRECIDEIVGYYNYGTFDKFRRRYNIKISAPTMSVVEDDPPSADDNEASERGKTMHSFNFSAEEEIGIIKACREAREYFEKYGKGYTPDHILMVNKKRYDN